MNSPRTNGRLKGLRILIVEDSEDGRHLLQTIFIESECIAVNDGEAALHLARAMKFDIILLDLELPKVGGNDVLATLRKEGYTLPIFIVSAHAMPDYIEIAMVLGATRYVTKPFLIANLIEWVLGAVSR